MKSRSSRDCSSTTSRSRCPNFIPSTLRLPAPQGAGEPQVASLPNSVICRMKKESCSFATNLKDSEANRRILMAPQGGIMRYARPSSMTRRIPWQFSCVYYLGSQIHPKGHWPTTMTKLLLTLASVGALALASCCGPAATTCAKCGNAVCTCSGK
jgi:hypothetical protein